MLEIVQVSSKIISAYSLVSSFVVLDYHKFNQLSQIIQDHNKLKPVRSFVSYVYSHPID